MIYEQVNWCLDFRSLPGFEFFTVMLHARKTGTAKMQRNRYQPWLIIVNMVFIATCITCTCNAIPVHHQRVSYKRGQPGISTEEPTIMIKDHTNVTVKNLRGATSPAYNATGNFFCRNIYVTTTSYEYLQSPNYPFDYNNNIDMCWVVRARDISHRVRLTVLASRMEGGSCTYDYVQVRDGQYSNSDLMMKFCGSSEPGPFTSSGPYLYVRFKTDSSNTFSGFRMKTLAVSHNQGCTEVTVSAHRTKYIRSPNYPFYYPNSVDKCWILHATLTGFNLRLRVLSSRIEYSTFCSADYVEIRDGRYAHSSLISRFCGTSEPGPFTSTDRSMYVNFHTDGSVVDYGFEMSVNIIPEHEDPNNNRRPIVIMGITLGGGSFIFICILICCLIKSETCRNVLCLCCLAS